MRRMQNWAFILRFHSKIMNTSVIFYGVLAENTKHFSGETKKERDAKIITINSIIKFVDKIISFYCNMGTILGL